MEFFCADTTLSNWSRSHGDDRIQAGKAQETIIRMAEQEGFRSTGGRISPVNVRGGGMKLPVSMSEVGALGVMADFGGG